MTKDMFVRAINEIKKHRARLDKFLEGLDAVSPGTYNETFLYSDYETLVIDMLMEAMDDKIELIPWWIYDTEFGAKETLKTLSIDNTEIELDSAEKLYEYLNK